MPTENIQVKWNPPVSVHNLAPFSETDLPPESSTMEPNKSPNCPYTGGGYNVY